MKRILVGFLSILTYFFSKLIKKNTDLYVIGSSLGQGFFDNSKYLYLYAQTKSSKKRLVWVTKNKNVVNLLKIHNLPVQYLYSFKGIFTVIRASKAFLTHSIDDINGALLGGALIIQLWHGVPLKNIDYKYKNNLKGRLRFLMHSLLPYHYFLHCDKLVACSEFSKDIYREVFLLPPGGIQDADDILILGQPRNDALFENYVFKTDLFPELDCLKSYNSEFNFIVSWLPTHRGQLGKSIKDLMSDFNHLNSFCEKNNILLVIKPHFLELEELNKYDVDKLSHIEIFSYDDPYPLLNFTDILITDYSSVYTDFLITNKPILFYIPDFEIYKKNVDFYCEYDDVTPGIKCFNMTDLIHGIITITSQGDPYEKIRRKFHKDARFVNEPNCRVIYDHFWTN